MSKRICTSCEDPIDENVTFQTDDEEIFEAVMIMVLEKDLCVECALTIAVIDQTQNAGRFNEDEF